MSKSFAVLTGDIARSRRLPQRRRSDLQRRLQTLLDSTSAELRKGVVSRLAITVGDEYQGVFRDAATALRAAILVTDGLRPLQLHHGLGIGALSTRVDPDYPGRMDGPCFHRARAAITESRRRKAWLTVRGLEEPDDQLASAAAALYARVRAGWTARQHEVIEAVERAPDQQAAARRLRVKAPTVTNVLKAAKYHELKQTEAALLDFLAHRFATMAPIPEHAP